MNNEDQDAQDRAKIKEIFSDLLWIVTYNVMTAKGYGDEVSGKRADEAVASFGQRED